jgi:hypothetical protein
MMFLFGAIAAIVQAGIGVIGRSLPAKSAAARIMMLTDVTVVADSERRANRKFEHFSNMDSNR